MENENDDLVYIAEDCNGSRTIAYKNDNSIHLVGDNIRSAYCCKYDNSDSSNICTAITKCSELTEMKFRPSKELNPKDDQNVLRLSQMVATNPLNNIVHDNLPTFQWKYSYKVIIIIIIISIPCRLRQDVRPGL